MKWGKQVDNLESRSGLVLERNWNANMWPQRRELGREQSERLEENLRP